MNKLPIHYYQMHQLSDKHTSAIGHTHIYEFTRIYYALIFQWTKQFPFCKKDVLFACCLAISRILAYRTQHTARKKNEKTAILPSTHVRKRSSEAQMILESSGMHAIAAYKPFSPVC